jgi:hypothetical protein
MRHLQVCFNRKVDIITFEKQSRSSTITFGNKKSQTEPGLESMGLEVAIPIHAGLLQPLQPLVCEKVHCPATGPMHAASFR